MNCITNYPTYPQHFGYSRTDGDSAHRREWKREVGPIPEGHEVHHLCGNKACHNIDHLALITKTNHRRLHMEMTTHCKYGHRRTNADWDRNRSRCRKCRRVGNLP